MVTEPVLLLSREHDRDILRAEHAAGRLRRVRRGAYRPSAQADVDAVKAHLRAVHAQLVAPHVFSHESAAYLWALRLWAPPTRAHVYQRSRAGGARALDIARHLGLPEQHVTLDGLPTTQRPRTVLDCLLTLRPLEALVVADSALQSGVNRGSLGALVEDARPRNGSARAAMVLELADAGSQSQWETWLRYVCLRAGLPRPVTQFTVETRLGPRDIDVAWPDHGVYLEFDGQVKYTDRRVLFEEKQREDAITEVLGVRPLRVVARDARNVNSLVSRILARFRNPPALNPVPRLPPP